MHDGNGFLTQHVALSAVFERSLQSIDPSLALPYWDFTIDSQAIIDRQKKGTTSTTSEGLESLFYGRDAAVSPLFTADWFGAPDRSTGVVSSSEASGHWSEAAVVHTAKSASSAAAASDSEGAVAVSNSFGLLRSPWNNLKSARVSRFFGACGATVSVDASSSSAGDIDNDAVVNFPACAAHFDAVANMGAFASLERPASESWALQVQGEPHGPVHLFLGGTTAACEAAYDSLVSECGLAPSTVAAWRLSAFGALKTLWREGLVEMDGACSQDTDRASDCSYSCPAIDDAATAELQLPSFDDAAGVSQYLAALSPFGMLDESLKSTVAALSGEQRVCAARAVCSGGVVTGDHIEAASPFDLSFWPVSNQ